MTYEATVHPSISQIENESMKSRVRKRNFVESHLKMRQCSTPGCTSWHKAKYDKCYQCNVPVREAHFAKQKSDADEVLQAMINVARRKAEMKGRR